MDILADVYHIPPISRSYPAAPPGARVAFHQGRARVVDERTLIWCLTMPQFSIQLQDRYLGHVSRWVQDLERRHLEPKASLIDPSGTIIPPVEYTQEGWQFPEIAARLQAAEA